MVLGAWQDSWGQLLVHTVLPRLFSPLPAALMTTCSLVREGLARESAYKDIWLSADLTPSLSVCMLQASHACLLRQASLHLVHLGEHVPDSVHHVGKHYLLRRLLPITCGSHCEIEQLHLLERFQSEKRGNSRHWQRTKCLVQTLVGRQASLTKEKTIFPIVRSSIKVARSPATHTPQCTDLCRGFAALTTSSGASVRRKASGYGLASSPRQGHLLSLSLRKLLLMN